MPYFFFITEMGWVSECSDLDSWTFLLINCTSVGGICLLEINSCNDDMMRIEGKERILNPFLASEIGMIGMHSIHHISGSF